MVSRIWITSKTEAAIRFEDTGFQNVSLDLGRTMESVVVRPDGLMCRGVTVHRRHFHRVAPSDNRIYLLDLDTMEGSTLALEWFGRYYSLVATSTAPTIMISGVQMHRRDDPWLDASRKAQRVVKEGDWVLDTCGGLGYTALSALKKGAGVVISTEPDPAVRWLRKNNPWSPGPKEEALLLYTETAEKCIEDLPDESFDTIIHDPPRFSLSGALYGALFYQQLRRVLKRGGRLYHYTGIPYKKRRGLSFPKGVHRRLMDAGFRITWDEETKGFSGKAL